MIILPGPEPQPRGDDPEIVKDFFERREAARKLVRQLNELITEFRRNPLKLER